MAEVGRGRDDHAAVARDALIRQHPVIQTPPRFPRRPRRRWRALGAGLRPSLRPRQREPVTLLRLSQHRVPKPEAGRRSSASSVT